MTGQKALTGRTVDSVHDTTQTTANADDHVQRNAGRLRQPADAAGVKHGD